MKLKFWQTPRLRTDEDSHKERKASWLELFFDLVFVAVVAILAHHLSAHPSGHTVGAFALTFVPVWWVWVGMTIYNDRLEVDDVSHRLLHWSIMVVVAAMAFFAHDAMGDKAEEFALAYAVARLIIVLAWVRGGFHNPEMRPLTNRYAIGYLISIFLFVISVFVPAPWKFVLWGVALFIDHATPGWTARIQANMTSLSMSHLPERMGLFTILVLGESVIGVANGMSQHPDFTLRGGVVAFLGLTLAFAVWWVYFQQVGGHHQKRGPTGLHRVWYGIGWVYLHLPLLMGLIGLGAATLQITTHANTEIPTAVRWLACGSIALVFVSVGAIGLTEELQPWERARPFLKWMVRGAAAAIAIVLGFEGGPLGPIGLLGTLLMLTGMQVMLNAFARREPEGEPQEA